eukprot:TRINITY_DN120097_c0_g1_i1.p1 TRINITY_DN120097_c0_g1~~TRINITY_DN120097_c0_g1_i1.p1  ORF type:complete len:1334 (+),score=125.61 TRINITY_DN120097_c0_g1_i1:1889-5890(+)
MCVLLYFILLLFEQFMIKYTSGNHSIKLQEYPQMEPRVLPKPPPREAIFTREAPVLGTKRTYTQFLKRPEKEPESPRTTADMPRPPSRDSMADKQEIQQCRDAVSLINQALINDEKCIDFEQLQTLEPAIYEHIDPPLKKVADIPIPEAIKAHYKSLGSVLKTSLSGILPEITRVYVTVNNRLYLWNYYNANELVSFDPVTRAIEAVAFSFIPSPVGFDTWIATDNEISLLQLAMQPTVQLLPTGYVVPTNGVSVNKILVTKSGRVFYGGNDGHLYEIAHKIYRECFRRRERIIRKDHSSNWLANLIPSLFDPAAGFSIIDICADETRNVLYTFSKRINNVKESRIVVYDLGAYGNTLLRVCTISNADIQEKLRDFDASVNYEEGVELVSVIPIERTSSNEIQLLIVCKTGLRIYVSFSVRNRAELLREDLILCDTQFTDRYSVVSIIYPPRFGPTTEETKEYSVDKAFYSLPNRFTLLSDISNGTCKLLYAGINEGALSISKHQPNTESTRTSFKVASTIEPGLTGLVIDIKEEPVEKKLAGEIIEMLGISTINLNPHQFYQGSKVGACSFSSMPPLSKSPYVPYTESYVLTSQSLAIFANVRGIDRLFSLVAHFPMDIYAINMVGKKYGATEASAMLLHIACNPSEQYFYPPEILAKKPAPGTIVKNATKAFFEIDYGVAAEPKAGGFNVLVSEKERIRSPRVDAVYAYIGRVVRPIWERLITKVVTLEDSDEMAQVPSWTFQQRKVIQQKLITVKIFIDQNFDSFFKHKRPSGILAKAVQDESRVERMLDTDKDDLELLKKALDRILEGLEFLSVMDDSEIFTEMLNVLSEEHQKVLSSTVFKQLVGKHVPESFIASFVFSYLAIRKEFEGIEQVQTAFSLHSRFPGYFTGSHLAFYRAVELLDKARNCEDQISFLPFIRECESLLFNNIECVDLYIIMPLLISLQQYTLATRLCLESAEENNIWTKSRVSHRTECYFILTSLIDEIYSEYLAVTKQSDRKTDSIFKGLFEGKSAEELLQINDAIIKEAINQTKDPGFHFQIFQWLSQNQLNDQLISIQSPHLDEFIATKAVVVSKTRNHTVYKYLLQKQKYKEAAQVLYELALKSNDELGFEEKLTLEDRMQYLNTALECLDNLEDAKDQHEVSEYRDSLDTCKGSLRIQMRILQLMETIKDNSREIEELENNFLTTQELYDNYAKRFGFWEIGLQLIQHSVKDEKLQQSHIAELNNIYRIIIDETYSKNQRNWPFEMQKKLHELAVKYHSPQEPAFFPLDTIIRSIESINAQHFSFEPVPDPNEPLSKFIDRIEYWLIIFLHSEPLKLRYFYRQNTQI